MSKSKTLRVSRKKLNALKLLILQGFKAFFASFTVKDGIIHYICMMSNGFYSEKDLSSAFSISSSGIVEVSSLEVINFSFTGYEKFLPIL